MLIKYFYHEPAGVCPTENLINGMAIKTNNTLEYLRKEEIKKLLTKDNVEVENIQSMKFKDPNDGFIEITDDARIPIDPQQKEVTLLLKMKEVVQVSDISKLLKHLQNKINELETKITMRNVDMSSQTVLYKEPSFFRMQSIKPQPQQSYKFSFPEMSLHISFLYANPIINEKKECFTEALDYESEMNCVVSVLEQSRKAIAARFEVANIETINEIFRKQPRVLHISCHGEYEGRFFSPVNKFSLLFEENGVLKKISADEFKTILSNNLSGRASSSHAIELVFLSACYSQACADFFLDAGIPVVICVNKYTKILDEAAQVFAKSFYKYLIEGCSIVDSFNRAKQILTQDRKFEGCCCNHKHLKKCPMIRQDHQSHEKKCSCSLEKSNLHRKNCPWAKNFMKDYHGEVIPSESNFHICCCFPLQDQDIPHDEFNKLELMCRDESSKYKIIFNNLNPGTLEIVNKSCFLNLKFSVDMQTNIIGRNKTLYDVLTNFTDRRLIVIYGQEGLGKHFFVQTAGRFMYERKFFHDGVVYINAGDEIPSEAEFVGKIANDLELGNKIEKLSEVIKVLQHSHCLIIISFGSYKQESIAQVLKILKKMIEETHSPKFLISSQEKLDTSICDSTQLELVKLKEYEASKLLEKLSGIYYPKILLNKNSKENAKILEHSGCIPRTIKKIAALFRENLGVAEAIKIISEDNHRLNDKLLSLIVNNREDPDKTKLLLQVLCVLSLLPCGILKSELQALQFFHLNDDFEFLDRICNSLGIVTKVFSNTFSESVYQLEKEHGASIEPLVTEEMKVKSINDLLVFYGFLLRNIVQEVSVDNDNEIEFSAEVNRGLWLTFNKEAFGVYQYSKVPQAVQRYAFAEENILSLLKSQKPLIRELLSKGELILKESFEQLTICIPTILKRIERKNDCLKYTNEFLNTCKEFNLTKAHARLSIFKYRLLFISPELLLMEPRFTLDDSIFDGFEEALAEKSFLEAVAVSERESKNPFSQKMIKQSLIESREKFKRLKNSLGLARVYLKLGNYYLDNENSEKDAIKSFDEGLDNANICKENILRARCLIGLSKAWSCSRNYENARYYLGLAKVSANEVKYNSDVANIIATQENSLFYKGKSHSHNIFVFIKAHQLVQANSSVSPVSSVPIAPVIDHFSDFRNIIENNLAQSTKDIIVKFDYLTTESLKEAMSITLGRVLCITSDYYNDIGSLFVEGTNGENCEISSMALREILRSNNTTFCYDTVILAIPQSEKLAETFVSEGVNHVICFKFNDEFLKEIGKFPTIMFMSVIQEFTFSFLNGIISNQQSISAAYLQAVEKFNFQIKSTCDKLYSMKFNTKETFPTNKKLGEVLLLPKNANHCDKLTSLESGNMVNKSKDRPALHHMTKREHAFIGRKKEICECVKKFINNNINVLNIYGPPGVGTTCLAKEICYFFHVRNYFMGGIFYFDLRKISEVQGIRNLFHTDGVIAAIEKFQKKTSPKINDTSFLRNSITMQNEKKAILVALDHVDKVICFDQQRFFSFLHNHEHIRFIIVSKESHKQMLEVIQVAQLNEIESVYFFLTYLNREITRQEANEDNLPQFLNKKEPENICELLLSSERILGCEGLPAKLKALALEATDKSLASIKLDDVSCECECIDYESDSEFSVVDKCKESLEPIKETNEKNCRATISFRKKNSNQDTRAKRLSKTVMIKSNSLIPPKMDSTSLIIHEEKSLDILSRPFKKRQESTHQVSMKVENIKTSENPTFSLRESVEPFKEKKRSLVSRPCSKNLDVRTPCLYHRHQSSQMQLIENEIISKSKIPQFHFHPHSPGVKARNTLFPQSFTLQKNRNDDTLLNEEDEEMDPIIANQQMPLLRGKAESEHVTIRLGFPPQEEKKIDLKFDEDEEDKGIERIVRLIKKIK